MAETLRMRSEPSMSRVQAPISGAAHQRRPRAGAETTDKTTLPSMVSAISDAQTGTPRMKLAVPSIGSMIQVRFGSELLPSVLPNSSPIRASSGRASARRPFSACSTERSASVTGLASGLVSTCRSCARKRSSEIASAMSANSSARARSSR